MTTLYVITAHAAKADRDRLSGALRYCYGRPDVNLVTLDGEATRPAVIRKTLKNADPATSGLFLLAHAELSRRCPLPAVVFHNASAPQGRQISTLRCDDGEIARTAARFLLQRGHRSFAYVGFPFGLQRIHSRAREQVFTAEISAAGLAVRTFDFAYARRPRFLAFLKSLPKPCAVFAYNDAIAQDVLNGCYEAQLAVPDQVNILGVDDDASICECVRPSLSSIQIDFEQAGFTAAELLQRKIAEPQREFASPTYGVRRIVERESTQDVNGQRRLVAAARDWLSDHYAEHVTVSALAGEMRTCRRRLEQCFRKTLGCTIHQELERLRIEAARRLLASTGRSVESIAESCGYLSVNAFRSAFRNTVGMTPRKWRERCQSA